MNRIIQCIVDALDPYAIYLFGSYAWGSPRSDSDIDLMVVVNPSSESRFQLSSKAFRSLRDFSSLPIDLLLRTVDEFDQYSNVKGTLNYKILNNGKKLYANF